MSGVERIVYGLKRVSSGCVEIDGGGMVRRPTFIADCRGCDLIGLVCEELEYPCQGVIDRCIKRTNDTECDGCETLDECLSSKPCCWDCTHLFECLEQLKDAGVAELVEGRFGCTLDAFLEAIKMLKGR